MRRVWSPFNRQHVGGGPKLCQVRFRLDIRKKWFLKKCLDVGHDPWSAQGDGGVPIPAGIEKTCRCGTKGQGLVKGLGAQGDGWTWQS